MARPIINKENIETKLEVRDDLAGPEWKSLICREEIPRAYSNEMKPNGKEQRRMDIICKGDQGP
jgi:hypothetical protein